MDEGIGWITKLIDSAKQLGTLDPATIWALLCILLIAYIVWMLKQTGIAASSGTEVRLKEVQADTAMSQAVVKMADDIAQLKNIVNELTRRDKPS